MLKYFLSLFSKSQLMIFAFISLGLIIFFIGLTASNKSQSGGTVLIVVICLFLFASVYFVRNWLKNSE